MSEYPSSAIGSVAQEAARLIEEMATIARSSAGRTNRRTPYAGRPAHEPTPSEAGTAAPSAAPSDAPSAGSGPAPRASSRGTPPDEDFAPADDCDGAPSEPRDGDCADCGRSRDGTPVACRLCPLCQGIALMRSVKPETVDLLADLALSVAVSLREVASRSRESSPQSSSHRASHSRTGGDRVTVQDIPVGDESEG